MNILQQNGFKETNKICVDCCNTTRTPLWRGGPAGSRTLCNACGIRYRKKNKALLGLSRDSRTEKSKSKKEIDINRSGIKTFSREMGLRRIMDNRELKSKLREEEEAAFLLMDLSSGYVYA